MNFGLPPTDGSRSTALGQALVVITLWSLSCVNGSAVTHGQDVTKPEAFLEAFKDVKDDSADVRLAAARKLGQLRLNPEAAVDALIVALNDSDLRVRVSAARAIGQFGKNAKTAAPALILAVETVYRLNDANGGSVESRAAARAVKDTRMVGETVISRESQFLAACVDTLGRIKADPDIAIPTLICALKNDHEVVRQNAAYALASMGADAVIAVNPLSAALGDESLGVRRAASAAFWKIGPVASAAVPALTKSLEDDDVFVRVRAAVALHKIAPERPHEAAVQTLLDALSDHDWRIRNEAAYAFTKINPGQITPDAVAALRDAQTDEHESVRRTATLSLSQIGTATTADDQSK